MKPIGKHVVNGSTLMGFGIAVFLLSLEALKTSKVVGVWCLVGGFYFLLLGFYDLVYVAVSKEFFEE